VNLIQKLRSSIAMKTITEYATARATNSTELDVAVNKMIKEGFQPYGDPYAADSTKDYGFRVSQAMVKYEME
jgi:hypothetical protein